MSILEKHIPFVNEQVEFQQKMCKKFADNPFRLKLHRATEEKFKALAADLSEADKMLGKATEASLEQLMAPEKGALSRVRLTLLPEDLEGLPEELTKELSIDAGKTEFAILNLLEESGGIMSLDQLLIGLFKKTGEVHKRQSLTGKLYRMGQQELVFSVSSKKGVYSNRQLTEEETEKLIG